LTQNLLFEIRAETVGTDPVPIPVQRGEVPEEHPGVLTPAPCCHREVGVIFPDVADVRGKPMLALPGNLQLRTSTISSFLLLDLLLLLYDADSEYRLAPYKQHQYQYKDYLSSLHNKFLKTEWLVWL